MKQSMRTITVGRSLRDLEHDGWSEHAVFYDDLFGCVSAQAIAPILDSFGGLKGKQLLDVACGTGHLVAAADQRGAAGVGVDFAATMVATAKTNYPDRHFRVADATALPFEGDCFDAVACCFGLSHMEAPQTAVQEAFRVLKPGGRFVFTLWYGADDGGELFVIAQDAVTRYAVSPVVLPEAWTCLRYANHERCEDIVKQAGFMTPAFLDLPITMQSVSAHPLLDIIGKLSIRTRMVLESQPWAVQQQIFDHAQGQIEDRRVDGVITIAWPALLTIAQKPVV